MDQREDRRSEFEDKMGELEPPTRTKVPVGIPRYKYSVKIKPMSYSRH